MDFPEKNILSFYDELRQLFLNIPDDDKIILLGDLNARVGRDSQTWKCFGSHGLGKANSNGLHLLQFLQQARSHHWKHVKKKKKIQRYMATPTQKTLAYDRLCYCSPA